MHIFILQSAKLTIFQTHLRRNLKATNRSLQTTIKHIPTFDLVTR